MDPLIFAAVLFAAACHAGWNTVLKGGGRPLPHLRHRPGENIERGE
jgi:hypothetical protein